ncbi:MAG: YlxR family protein [Firmicutes bacterium]|nr:YlxR family protein [Bacillota bacterium]
MPRQKRIPMRTCVGCRTVRPKRDMIRIVRRPTGEIDLDETGKASGRGAYICPVVDCLDAAVKSKALQRSLEKDIPDEVWEELQSRLRGEG